jgi:hypothetical protein
MTEQEVAMPNEKDEQALVDAAREAQKQKLLDQVDADWPEAWIPEEGQTIVGVLVRKETAPSAFGEREIIVLADPGTGVESSVWLNHAALTSEIYRVKPQAGEMLAIKYLGPDPEAKPKDGRAPAHRYRVAVDRGETPITWDDPVEPIEAAPVTQQEPDLDLTPGPDDDLPF